MNLVPLAAVFVFLLAFAPLASRLLCRAFGLVRPNFRGEAIPASVGLTFLLVAGVFYGVLSGGASGNSGDIRAFAPLFLLVALGFGVLGLIDDVWGARADGGGFRAHLKQAARGKLTTGFIKLLGGGVIALLAAYWAGGMHYRDALWQWSRPSPLLVCADAALIALAANAMNLLDTRPGRATFGFAIMLAPVVVVVAPLARVLLTAGGGASGGAIPVPPVALLAPLILAVALEWLPDARARAMMGDVGSNLLGALAGLALVVTLPLSARLVSLALLFALNAQSERVSLNAVIERTPWLRAIDRALGVRAATPAPVAKAEDTAPEPERPSPVGKARR